MAELTKLVLHWGESRFQVLLKERATGKIKVICGANAKKSVTIVTRQIHDHCCAPGHKHVQRIEEHDINCQALKTVATLECDDNDYDCTPKHKHAQHSEECDSHCHALGTVTAFKSTQNFATHPSRDKSDDYALEHKRACNIKENGTKCYVPEMMDVSEHARGSIVPSTGGSCESSCILVQNIAAHDTNRRTPKFATQILAHRIKSVDNCTQE